MMNRRYLLFWLSVEFVLALVLSGCGGGPDPFVFQDTRTIGPAGGSLGSELHGVSVIFPKGTLSAETPVTLSVKEGQFEAIGRDGYLHSENGVILRFDPTAVAPDQELTIELGHQGDYDSFGTLLAVMRDDGAFIALPSEQAEPGQVKGELTKATLNALFANEPAGEEQNLKIFSANRLSELKADPLITNVEVFENGSFGGNPPDLNGKRVAVVVHGLDSSLGDLSSLGQFISDFKQTGETVSYYEVVIGFNYTSNAPLTEIGTALASAMDQVGLQMASAVDVFAHSMGNLVSRYAMETLSVPNRIANVGHYVSLGGPHDGVPFGDLTYAVQTFFYLFPLAAKPSIEDLLTNGKEGEPETDFLKNLNLEVGQQGPNYTTTQYYTMSGSDWDDYDPPAGYTVSWLYSFSVGSDVVEDGLVAQYSAQSALLSRQSQTWQANAPFDLSHTELHESPVAFEQIGSWIDSWQ